MRYLHTMIRAANLEQTLHFFVDQLGLVEAYRYENEAGRFTLVFLSAPGRPRQRENTTSAVSRNHL